VAKESVDREIGEIKACLVYVKQNIVGLDSQIKELSTRISTLEQFITKHEALAAEVERQKETNNQSVNVKIAVAAVVITVVGLLLDIALRYYLNV
jgi:prefoldin subunit 5